MSAVTARLLVFCTSAAVLILEILAGRLLAPYVGVTLETFTGIIGTVLAGIAIGAWLGGRAADRIEPRRLLAPLLVVGGLLTLVAPPIINAIGPRVTGSDPVNIVTLTVLAFFLPAAVLSAVTPVVVKIRLHSLDETGQVVGSLSAIGTTGAIVGTFLTGFVLIAAWPSRPIVFALGAALIVAGLGIGAADLSRGALAAIVIPGVLGGLLLFTVNGPCETETAYFCARVEVDAERPTGRVLWLDTLRHSYVDLEDPTYLDFRYAKIMADVLASTPPGPLDVLFIGGGGFTLPRYIAEVRPGSTSLVLELDPTLVDIARVDLGLVTSADLAVQVGDARLLLADAPAGQYDAVIGDAFGGLSVPWHLTTEEFVTEIRERLTPTGYYLLNMIDYPPLGFARAEAATLADVFTHVAVIAPRDYLDGTRGGNFVMVASDSPIDTAAITASIRQRGGLEVVVGAAELARFLEGADVLRDDFAPVDQLISRP